MVIQCKQCETTYNLDEALLANGNIDVRCVRCKNVFTVAAPAPQIEPISTFQAEIPAPTAEQSPSVLQQEESSLPDWNSDEDSFSFAEADSFSFEEELADQDEAPEGMDDGGEFSFATETPASDSLPQEFSFESISPEPESAPAQQFSPRSSDSEPEQSVPDSATTETANQPVRKPAPQPKEKAKTSKLAWFLLLIIMLVAGAYGYGYVIYGTTDVLQMIRKVQQQFAPAPQQPRGSIHVDTSESYYVENTAAGQLFIIQGHAVNNFPEPRSELKVVATLYKEKGIPLLNQSAYCGNIISKSDLEKLPLHELLETINNPFGTALSNVGIAPGQSRPFMVVFSEIPESLTEFSVEAESSKAASK